nr:MAG TPA: hypothetical protein [Caudoviricetes sp.]
MPDGKLKESFVSSLQLCIKSFVFFTVYILSFFIFFLSILVF